ncbi:MAG: NUDIX domain-containing protein [Pedosphaera sp.]|nr:NUDIX domain-containing protein [Pedosphaera sp.]
MKIAAEEVFDVVDENDQVISQRSRRDVHRLDLRHRAVHVLIYNQRGELFLQQRSLSKDCSPGVWDSSASGHLDSGETYEACALREVAEELGIILPVPPQALFKLPASRETGQEFCWVYRAAHNGPFVLQPSEVRGGGWFLPTAITQWSQHRPDDFASSFLLIWKRIHLS